MSEIGFTPTNNDFKLNQTPAELICRPLMPENKTNLSYLENEINKPSETVNFKDDFKLNNNYTVGRGAIAVAKIGAGLFASDQMVQAIYPGKIDKRYHSLAGGIISGVTGEVTTALTHKRWLGALTGTAMGTVAGLAKEVWDKQGHGTPDKKDFYATALGALTVGVTLTIPL